MIKLKKKFRKLLINTNIGYQIINSLMSKIPELEIYFDGYDDYEDLAEQIYTIIIKDGD